MATIIGINPFHKYLVEAMQKSVETEANKIFDQAVKDFEARRGELVASIVMQISKQYSFERMGETLRIEVINKENNGG